MTLVIQLLLKVGNGLIHAWNCESVCVCARYIYVNKYLFMHMCAPVRLCASVVKTLDLIRWYGSPTCGLFRYQWIKLWPAIIITKMTPSRTCWPSCSFKDGFDFPCMWHLVRFHPFSTLSYDWCYFDWGKTTWTALQRFASILVALHHWYHHYWPLFISHY